MSLAAAEMCGRRAGSGLSSVAFAGGLAAPRAARTEGGAPAVFSWARKESSMRKAMPRVWISFTMFFGRAFPAARGRGSGWGGGRGEVSEARAEDETRKQTP